MSWSRWYLINEGAKPVIRRYRRMAGKIQWERLPHKEYENLPKDELRGFLNRINVTRQLQDKQALERYSFDHSFVKSTIVEGFEQLLLNSSSNRGHVTRSLSYLKRHSLDFFINKKKLPHPNFWLSCEEEWGAYLIKTKLSPSTLKNIIQVTNRFLKYMFKKYPKEVQAVILEPISKKKLQDLSARRPNLGRLKYINDKDYADICSKADESLRPYIVLAYCYGLRRAEIYALDKDNSIYESHVLVQKQIVAVEPRIKYGPLKNKQIRRVPHWFSQPDMAYECIAGLKRMHPDTLSHLFDQFMNELKMPFQFHDLRRTFITRALRAGHNIRDVQLAAGHYDIKTTISYAQDDREMSEKKWRPGDPTRTRTSMTSLGN